MELYLAVLGASLLNGLAGSLHCVGMCGPLAGTLSIFSPSGDKSGNIFLQFSYNTGRLFSYSLIGLLLGLLGEGANLSFSILLPFQEISAWIGIFFLAVIGLYFLFGKHPGNPKYFTALIGKFAKPILGELKEKPVSRTRTASLGFSFGLLTGLLPCGILYPAFITAFASGSPALGSAIMATFFLGTFPLLFLFGIGFKSVFQKFRGNLLRYAGSFAVAVSIFMIVLRFYHDHSQHKHSVPDGLKTEHSHNHHH